MKKPAYELIPLRVAIGQCQTNITAFQQATINEQKKIAELQGYIKDWEEYNTAQEEEQKRLEANGGNIRQG